VIDVDIRDAVTAILARRASVSAPRAILAGVSGIDASGKGFVAARLAAARAAACVNAVTLGVDGWLELQVVTP
jgi:uridine kinase